MDFSKESGNYGFYMKTTSTNTLAAGLVAALFMAAAPATSHANFSITTYATNAGDTSYGWNSKYGPYGYGNGGTTLGVGLAMGAPYGNDYTNGIVEIAIPDLQGGNLLSATLTVYSEGFGTGYYYGSAGMYWVAPSLVTGDPQADSIGAMLGAPSIAYGLWDSTTNQGAGWFSFDVTANVQSDAAAGRAFSTFILGGSRDTGGGIRASEYGSSFGPQMTIVTDATAVPEPATWGLLAMGFCSLSFIRRRLLA